eukprot:CAMPEP_0176437298 /NCGR_PEP_ID=MMETSP0127-20121128/18527_1 /TAXON_ID=938130 /ORGANISM="Platyophrya macrostoma, Strain WH" /LENGTH=42 /DNA_ID= /DNA_START= /DNA_END= /DNA_ORIENTATION=
MAAFALHSASPIASISSPGASASRSMLLTISTAASPSLPITS